MVKSRAFLLVMVLMLLGILLVLGLALLGKRSSQYQASDQAVRAARARALAEAGLEDTRVKLERDPNFPPLMAEDQPRFTYSEVVFDLDGTTVVGRYDVTIDRTWEKYPYNVWKITSVGSLSDTPTGVPLARRTLSVELDVSEKVRGTASPNPDYYHYINLEDQGGY